MTIFSDLQLMYRNNIFIKEGQMILNHQWKTVEFICMDCGTTWNYFDTCVATM